MNADKKWINPDVILRAEGPKDLTRICQILRAAKAALRMTAFLSVLIYAIFFSPAYAVEIEPMRLEHTLEPGRTYSGSFKLKNSSQFSVDVLVSTGDYRYILSKGAIPPQDLKRTLPSCQGWFQFDKTKINLNPGVSAETKFLIKVPRDAGEEHLCAVLFDERRSLQEIQSKQKAGNVQIQLTPRFSIPVYISIKGNEKASAEIKELLVVTESQKDGLIINIILENTGTVHIRPFGTLVILNQNGEVIKNLPIGKALPIFPGYKETLSIPCPKIPKGRYSAIATVEISKDNIVQKKTSFESRPWHE